MRVYLDNISGTPLDDEVFNAMVPYLKARHGNPGSQNVHGREAYAAIEKCRLKISQCLNVQPEGIAFTSGGNEAIRVAILSAVESTGIDHVVTTKYEHPTVLETLSLLQRKQDTRISYVKHKGDGTIDIHHLEYLLRTNTRNFVSVSHANIETGNLNDIGRISGLCEHYKALLHIDAIQTLGQYRYDLSKLKLNFLTASADKFYGPSGIGFLYSRNLANLSKLKYDKDFNDVTNAVGMTKALEIAYRDLAKRREYVENLKKRLINCFLDGLSDFRFVGNSAVLGKSHFAILTVEFPKTIQCQTLIQYLDDYHISVSSKSNSDSDLVHFSLSKFNTIQELDYVFEKLLTIYERVSI
ncbi:MAG: cysteine desulfurase [Mucilaginibacter sp.]|nr:cysteine desulfurase [Mucilaginibacter sp.]